MSARATGLSTNSLYNSYEYFFGKRKGAMTTEKLVELESERVGALGTLLAAVDAILIFQANDGVTAAHLATLREMRDRYDEITKLLLDARLNERKTIE